MDRIIYGKNVVFELLSENPEKIRKIFLSRKILNKDFYIKVGNLARKNNIFIEDLESNFQKLKNEIDGVNHQGVAALVFEFKYADLFEELKISKNTENKKLPLFLMLDRVQDPQNLGAIIRTAESFKVNGIIIPERRAAKITPAVAKVASGALNRSKIIIVTNLVNTIEEFKSNGFWVVGAEEDAKDNLFDIDYKMPVLLVMGSESEGIGRLIKEKCDFLVKIPFLGKTPSLNVSVATGIMLFEIFKQKYIK